MTEASRGPSCAERACSSITPKVCIVLCCFLATFSAYVERVGFSIAFTAMAKAAELDEHVKGNVLSAFYWGYGVSQVGPIVPHPIQEAAVDHRLALIDRLLDNSTHSCLRT